MNDSFKHFFAMFVGTGLSIVIGLITTPIVTRIVSPADYGNLSIFILLGNVFLVVATLGRENAYNRYYYTEDSKEYKKYILGATARLPITICIITSILILAYYLVWGKSNVLIPIFVIYACALVLERFSSITLRLKMKTRIYATLINIQKIVYVVFVLLAVCFTELDHLCILALGTLIALIVIVLVGIISERDVWSVESFLNIKKSKFTKTVNESEIFRYSLPFVFSSVCAWAFVGADKFMLKLLSTDVELGIYASATSIIGILSIVTTTFNTIWAPMAVEAYEKDFDKSFFIKATEYISIIIVITCAIVVLFKDLIIFFLGIEYRSAVYLLPFLTLNPVMYTVSESTVNGINFMKKTYLHVVITGICSVVNIALNMFLIIKIGALGAAIATGISYILFFVLRTYFSVKCFNVKYNISKIMLLFIPYCIFIIYSSFYKTNIVSVILFLAICIVGTITYKERIIELIEILMKYIKPFDRKKEL